MPAVDPNIWPKPWLPVRTLTCPWNGPITVGNIITDPNDPTSTFYEEPDYLSVPVLESRRYNLTSQWDYTTTPARSSLWTSLPTGMSCSIEYEVEHLDTEVLERTPHVLEEYMEQILGRAAWVGDFARAVASDSWGTGRERDWRSGEHTSTTSGSNNRTPAGEPNSKSNLSTSSSTPTIVVPTTTPSPTNQRRLYLITGIKYATGVTLHTERKVWGPEVQPNHGEEHAIPVMGQTVWVPVWSRQVQYDETHDVVLSYKVMELVWVEGEGEREGGEEGRFGLEEYAGRTEAKDVGRLVEEHWDRAIGVLDPVV
ncbi:hypothetical protein ASPCADRAFT_404879 [Aspergillus carbonarius ITEM 5010]|uniref:Uncharacterized protein n=1 Tax=Aspergillus carbonarius (strain ITEM 5010) TaxID=602072 RepID=A0A1R3RPC3_ASPC5|nr:hypothetical protein ASPCADRAFT_404879 [Aspergillus carbonarius ITEM 5010]